MMKQSSKNSTYFKKQTYIRKEKNTNECGETTHIPNDYVIFKNYVEDLHFIKKI